VGKAEDVTVGDVLEAVSKIRKKVRAG